MYMLFMRELRLKFFGKQAGAAATGGVTPRENKVFQKRLFWP